MNRVCSSAVYFSRYRLLSTSCCLSKGNGTTPIVRNLLLNTLTKTNHITRRCISRANKFTSKNDIDGIPKNYTLIYQNSSALYFIWLPIFTSMAFVFMVVMVTVESIKTGSLGIPGIEVPKKVVDNNFNQAVFVLVNAAILSYFLAFIARRNFIRIYKDLKSDRYKAVKPGWNLMKKTMNFRQKDITFIRGTLRINMWRYNVDPKDFESLELYNEFIGYYTARDPDLESYLKELKRELGESKRKKQK